MPIRPIDIRRKEFKSGFRGYEPNQVGKAAYLSGLPKKYEPIVRYRMVYGQTEKLGITYTYDYKVSRSACSVVIPADIPPALPHRTTPP